MPKFILTAPVAASGTLRFAPGFLAFDTDVYAELTPTQVTFNGTKAGNAFAFGGIDLAAEVDAESGWVLYSGTVTDFNFSGNLNGVEGVQIQATGLSVQAFDALFMSDIDRFSALVQGDDEIIGSQLNDLICAGYGNDTVEGNLGDDTLDGNQWDNRGDMQRVDDFLFGGAGQDQLISGGDHDTLHGGQGQDMFVMAGLGWARVEDFSHRDDTIGLAYLEELGGPGRLAAKYFHVGKAAHDASDRIIYQRATGQIWFDMDGKGGGRKHFLAQVDPGTFLDLSDFRIVTLPEFPL